LVKHRAPEKELPLIASDMAMVATICDTGDSRLAPLARKFWPGPLTIILPSFDRSKTYAIRVSSDPIAHQIVQAYGSPLVSTSANISGRPPVVDPRRMDESIRDAVAVLIDAGFTPGGAPSTIVSLIERPGKIVRQGAIPATQIVSFI
jgi:L-threonylcarbamoyladenylate synthase